jgi:hypothetical protein
MVGVGVGGRVVRLGCFAARSTLPHCTLIRAGVVHDGRLGVGGEYAHRSARHGGEVGISLTLVGVGSGLVD